MKASTAAREFTGYIACSAVAFAVDTGLLTLLVSWVGLHYLPAAAIGFVAGGAVLYLLCIRFVFSRRTYKAAVELPYFIGLGLVGLLVNVSVMLVAVESAQMHYLVAKMAASACTLLVNFALRRTLLFTPVRELE